MCMYVYVCVGEPDYKSTKDNRKKVRGKIIAVNV